SVLAAHLSFLDHGRLGGLYTYVVGGKTGQHHLIQRHPQNATIEGRNNVAASVGNGIGHGSKNLATHYPFAEGDATKQYPALVRPDPGRLVINRSLASPFA